MVRMIDILETWLIDVLEGLPVRIKKDEWSEGGFLVFRDVGDVVVNTLDAESAESERARAASNLLATAKISRQDNLLIHTDLYDGKKIDQSNLPYFYDNGCEFSTDDSEESMPEHDAENNWLDHIEISSADPDGATAIRKHVEKHL